MRLLMVAFYASSYPQGGPSGRPLFYGMPETGRRIDAGFTHLQRIENDATTTVWFSEDFSTRMQESVEWAAVRQFDLLQESENLLYIYDLDVSVLKRAIEYLSYMRADGYRLTIISLGHYASREDVDELALLDHRIQDELTRLIHFLYLQEMSEQATNLYTKALDENLWKYQDALPHIALTQKSRELLKPKDVDFKEQTFLKILERLPNRHIVHDAAMGLMLPENTTENKDDWIPDLENKLFNVQESLSVFFRNLDENRTTMPHMRGYGDHTIQGFMGWQHDALQQLTAH